MPLILDLIFPRSCSFCHQSHSYICPQCQETITQRSIKYSLRSRFEGRLSLFRYDGIIKQLISDIKYEYVSDIIPELSLLVTKRLNKYFPNLVNYWSENKFTFIPVPLHPLRANWRGFNQSELLCSKISSQLGIRSDPALLIRTKDTLPQVSFKDKFKRQENMTSCFKLADKTVKNVILFDDVYTTGSTMEASALAFPKNTHIWALTLAG